MSKKEIEDDVVLTLGQVKSLTGNTNFEAVTYLNIYGSGIRDVSKISMLKSLTMCMVANNYISDISPLMKCRNLFKIDASCNKISVIPPAEQWANLNNLRILYLHDNALGKLEIFQTISGARNVSVMTMFDTPVSLMKHYRHHAVNTIWSLRCLDQLVISDEEVIEDAKFHDRFCAYHPELRIGALPYITKELSETDAVKQSLQTLKLVEGVLRKHSPVIIIQRAWRNKKDRRRQIEMQQLRHWAAVCIQRCWRMKHGLPQQTPSDVTRRRNTDVFSPITVASHSDNQQIPPSSQEVKLETSPTVEGSLSPQAPSSPVADSTGTTQDKVPFRINSAKLRDSIKTKTSFNKVWGAVPFRAGLEGNIFAKRSALEELRRERMKEKLDTQSQVQSGMEELELVAERTTLKEPDTYKEMLLSCREAGRIVREAASHYKQIEKYRPKTVKMSSRPKNPVGNSQRLFTKLQDTMALSCLKAVQQAYKNRAQLESHAAGMDKVLLQRHHHKVMLARVDAIKNAARIETLHQREIDDSKIRDSHYKMQEKERREMMKVLNKRSIEEKLKKDRKQYKQFMTDFCCQNASLSKALARHDRRTIKDDLENEAQDKVALLRDQNIRSQNTVTEYKDFVKLRRQAEAQYDRAQVHTVLYEEKKRREQDILDRIDYLRSIRSKTTDDMESPVQVQANSETEIISNYKTSIAKGQDKTLGAVIRGRAINRGSCSPNSGGSKHQKPQPPRHLGTIKFDLTLPNVGEFTSKVSISHPETAPSGESSLEPVKLNRLFLNDSPNFPVVPHAPFHERDLII